MKKKGIYKIVSFIICLSMVFCAIPVSVSNAVDIYSGTEFLFGDVNEDGLITSTDSLLALRYSIKVEKLYGVKKAAADVDLRVGVDSIDALLILKYSIKKISRFDVGVTGIYRSDDVSDFGFNDLSNEVHWCYKQITEKQKRAYNILVNAAQNYQTGLIEVGKVADGFTVNDAKVAYQAVIRDHPEIFWIPSVYLLSRSSKYIYVGMDHTTEEGYVASYSYSYEFIKQHQLDIGYAINVAFNQCLNPKMTEGERALALHDWLCKITSYDLEAACDLTNHQSALSAYNALILDTAVCEGLTKAYQMLLYKAGIDSICIVSDYHMWNEVCIDGDWYYTDITWDDNDNDNDVPLYFSYNQTYKHIKLSHPTMSENITDFSNVASGLPTDFNFNLPDATAIEENWYYKNDLVYDNWGDFTTYFPARLAKAIRDGDRDIQFMINGLAISTFEDYYGYILPVVNAANQINNELKYWIVGYSTSYVIDSPGAIIYCDVYGE